MLRWNDRKDVIIIHPPVAGAYWCVVCKLLQGHMSRVPYFSASKSGKKLNMNSISSQLSNIATQIQQLVMWKCVRLNNKHFSWLQGYIQIHCINACRKSYVKRRQHCCVFYLFSSSIILIPAIVQSFHTHIHLLEFVLLKAHCCILISRMPSEYHWKMGDWFQWISLNTSSLWTIPSRCCRYMRGNISLSFTSN